MRFNIIFCVIVFGCKMSCKINLFHSDDTFDLRKCHTTCRIRWILNVYSILSFTQRNIRYIFTRWIGHVSYILYSTDDLLYICYVGCILVTLVVYLLCCVKIHITYIA